MISTKFSCVATYFTQHYLNLSENPSWKKKNIETEQTAQKSIQNKSLEKNDFLKRFYFGVTKYTFCLCSRQMVKLKQFVKTLSVS